MRRRMDGKRPGKGDAQPQRRGTRYQGAIVRDGLVLLIRHHEHASGRSYWLLPGGGIEPGETAEQCVQRKMQEETGLTVHVMRMLFEVPSHGEVYQRHQTYLCTPVAGEAAPGYEPEPEVAHVYAITGVRWVSIAGDTTWGDEIHGDEITLANMHRVQQSLTGQ